jgi:hypothetical protein
VGLENWVWLGGLYILVDQAAEDMSSSNPRRVEITAVRGSGGICCRERCGRAA